MTIKGYLEVLEETKNKVLSFNLPPETEMVGPPNWGFFNKFNDFGASFCVYDAYRDGNLFSKKGDENLKVETVLCINRN